MEELLLAQFENRASFSMFNGLAKFNLNLLLFQINKKCVVSLSSVANILTRSRQVLRLNIYGLSVSFIIILRPRHDFHHLSRSPRSPAAMYR